ncbi:hypothetical protein B0J18DRAFT_43934 [Chaetomium sp. MPI-SDFR-AT-0129]|nr:hypothetical protein B0J18DRAFT_43934 [Chaetomium sp. MPI-SDFR-AT-0129]
MCHLPSRDRRAKKEENKIKTGTSASRRMRDLVRCFIYFCSSSAVPGSVWLRDWRIFGIKQEWTPKPSEQRTSDRFRDSMLLPDPIQQVILFPICFLNSGKSLHLFRRLSLTGRPPVNQQRAVCSPILSLHRMHNPSIRLQRSVPACFLFLSYEGSASQQMGERASF